MEKAMLYMALFIVVIAGLLLFVICSNLHNFPYPTGKFGVGKTDYHLININSQETNNKGVHRELMLHIWYPTDQKIRKASTPYDFDALTNLVEFMSQRSNLPAWLFYGLYSTKTYAQPNIAVSNSAASYPVIIVTHGTSTMVQQYTWLCEELTSQGYIVIGINHPYMAAVTRFLDGRVIKSLIQAKRTEDKQRAKKWKQEQLEIAVQDSKFVLDSLEALNAQPTWFLHNRLDLKRIGMCGHSSGGSVTMGVCLDDVRIKAGVSLDGTTCLNKTLTIVDVPFLELLAEESHVWKEQEGERDRNLLDTLQSLPGMKMSVISLKNVGHNIFSDMPLLLHSTIMGQILSRHINIDVNVSSKQSFNTMQLAKKSVVSFFDTNLK